MGPFKKSNPNKVEMPKLVSYLNGTPLFQQYVIRRNSKNKD